MKSWGRKEGRKENIEWRTLFWYFPLMYYFFLCLSKLLFSVLLEFLIPKHRTNFQTIYLSINSAHCVHISLDYLKKKKKKKAVPIPSASRLSGWTSLFMSPAHFLPFFPVTERILSSPAHPPTWLVVCNQVRHKVADFPHDWKTNIFFSMPTLNIIQ